MTAGRGRNRRASEPTHDPADLAAAAKVEVEEGAEACRAVRLGVDAEWAEVEVDGRHVVRLREGERETEREG